MISRYEHKPIIWHKNKNDFLNRSYKLFCNYTLKTVEVWKIINTIQETFCNTNTISEHTSTNALIAILIFGCDNAAEKGGFHLSGEMICKVSPSKLLQLQGSFSIITKGLEINMALYSSEYCFKYPYVCRITCRSLVLLWVGLTLLHLYNCFIHAPQLRQQKFYDTN